VIDYLKARQTAPVVYIYFDYDNQKNQTPVNIITSLLKQLVCQLGLIPMELQGLYEKCITESSRLDFYDAARDSEVGAAASGRVPCDPWLKKHT
jgi:hypothetical protein